MSIDSLSRLGDNAVEQVRVRFLSEAWVCDDTKTHGPTFFERDIRSAQRVIRLPSAFSSNSPPHTYFGLGDMIDTVRPKNELEIMYRCTRVLWVDKEESPSIRLRRGAHRRVTSQKHRLAMPPSEQRQYSEVFIRTETKPDHNRFTDIRVGLGLIGLKGYRIDMMR